MTKDLHRWLAEANEEDERKQRKPHPSEGGLPQQVEITYPWELFKKVDHQRYYTAASLDAQLKAFDNIKRVVLQGYK